MAIEFIEFAGTYRRQIDLKTWNGRTVVGWLEDDYHHFGITLCHNGSAITDVRVAEPRHPWTACPGAAEPLRNLVGKPLFGRCSDIGEFIDMRLQCTHLFDLAGLLVAHAFHRRDHHRYHATVRRLDEVEPDGEAGWLRAALSRDGVEVMQWDVDDNVIMRPECAAGRSIDRGFREWVETLDTANAEYAFVTRRAVFVSNGRKIVLTEPHVADEMPMLAVCHNYQPQHRKDSMRVMDSIRRFDTSPEDMLSLVGTKP